MSRFGRFRSKNSPVLRNTSMRKLNLLAAAAAICCSVANAAPIRFLAWDDDVSTRKLGVVSGKGVDPIANLHPFARSKEVTVTLGEEGLVIRALDRTTPDGKPVDFKVDKAAGLKSPVVLLMPDPKMPSGLRGVAFEDSRDTFPWGTVRFVNTTGKPLGLMFGKTKKVLPASWTPVDIKPEGDKSNSVLIYTQDDPSKASYTSLWTQDPDKRRLAILAPSSDVRLGSLAVKVIPEDRLETLPVREEP